MSNWREYAEAMLKHIDFGKIANLKLARAEMTKLKEETTMIENVDDFTTEESNRLKLASKIATLRFKISERKVELENSRVSDDLTKEVLRLFAIAELAVWQRRLMELLKQREKQC